jgi:hypothetical protein
VILLNIQRLIESHNRELKLGPTSASRYVAKLVEDARRSDDEVTGADFMSRLNLRGIKRKYGTL